MAFGDFPLPCRTFNCGSSTSGGVCRRRIELQELIELKNLGTDTTFFRNYQEVATSSQQIGENSWAFGSDIIGYVKNLKFSKKNLMELSIIRILLNLLGNISEGDALHCILRRGKEYKSLMVVLEKDGHENVLMRYFVNNIFKYLDIV